MTRIEKIAYILKYQIDLDERSLDDFPEIPYSKEDLDAMNGKELREALQNIFDAEQITENLYNAEVIRHGRSE